MVKNLPAMWETQVLSLGQEDPLGKGMATHSSVLAWRIPWIEEYGWLQSRGLQRVGHSWVTNTFSFHTSNTAWTSSFLKTYQIRSDQLLSCVWLFVTILKKNIDWLIWLCQVLVAACRIFNFHCGMQQFFNCSMWDLVPWPGIESSSPTLGAEP